MGARRKPMKAKVFVIQSPGLGRSDDKLGAVLMRNFLRLLGESPDKPATIVFWNEGVKLACEGSDVLEYLKRLEEQGIELVSCTSCLEFFNLTMRLKAGKPTTMPKIIATLMENDVVTL
jgi:selenium metabolism protein YedF